MGLTEFLEVEFFYGQMFFLSPIQVIFSKQGNMEDRKWMTSFAWQWYSFTINRITQMHTHVNTQTQWLSFSLCLPNLLTRCSLWTIVEDICLNMLQRDWTQNYMVRKQVSKPQLYRCLIHLFIHTYMCAHTHAQDGLEL